MLAVPELSTGLVIAGAFADKLRRVLFAALSDKLPRDEIVRAASELNQLLYRVIVEELGLGKGDAVRIRVHYAVENGRVRWLTDTLRIEAWRRVPDEEVAEAVRRVLGGGGGE